MTDTRDIIKALSDQVRTNYVKTYEMEAHMGYSYLAGYLESMLIRAIDTMPPKARKEYMKFVDELVRYSK